MIYRSPSERKRHRRAKFRLLALLIGGFVILTILDFPLRNLFYNAPDSGIEHHDWYRALRVLGFMGTWIIVGLIFILYDRNRHRGLAIIFATLLSGALAELGKLIIGRERPVDGGVLQDGFYHFRPFLSGFTDGSNLGLPSSHASVAFAGCVLMSSYLPNTRRLFVLLAIGCAITRMLTGAHFATDVYLGGLIGWMCASMFYRLTPDHAR